MSAVIRRRERHMQLVSKPRSHRADLYRAVREAESREYVIRIVLTSVVTCEERYSNAANDGTTTF
jgi:hypothetical protein